MDMIRWLATNKVVVTVWGLGILAILLASIFGGGKKAENVTAAETKVVEAVVEKAEPAKAAVTTTAAVATTAAASTALAAVGTSTEAKAEVEEKVSDGTQVAAADATKASDNAAGDSQDKSNTSTESSPDESTAAVKDDDLAGKSSDDLLMMAREAYWDNGLDKAASLYSELITREPDVVEHKGELGNVFWRQGYPKKAAELYADIAEPMIAKGNGERVSNMVGFIGLFFPERAGNIRSLLDAQ